MKTLMPSFIVVLIIITSSCSNNNQKVNITEKIEYDVIIKSPNPSYDHWIQNIEDSKRVKFITTLLDAAYSGRMVAYDYFGKPISITELNSIGADTIYKILTRSYPPYAEYDTVITSKLQISDINRVRFREEWLMDEATLDFDKKIIAIAPVIDKYDAEGNYIAKQPLFWLYLDQDFNKK